MSFRAAWRILAVSLLIVLLLSAGLLLVIEVRPSFGAQAAAHMRVLFGPRLVAALEGFVFQVQDTLHGWQFRLSPREIVPPWQDQAIPGFATPELPVTYPPVSVTPSAVMRTTTPGLEGTGDTALTPTLNDQQARSYEVLPTGTTSSSPIPSLTPYHWQLPDLAPFGALQNEGIWQPYLYNPAGQVVGMRTFLQPDPERPYTLVAVVAVDLNRARLHFVLGFNEPSIPDGPRGEGLIPQHDRQAGFLLAAFNGGFRAANGHFGAMADGIMPLPPKESFATLAITHDGEVRIGNWGAEITDTPDLRAWRQNCHLIIQEGAVSPRVFSDSITDWGASISNQIVTRRSAVGLDRQSQTLYYFAGPSLSMPVLAETMMAAGVYNGMLLDINHFWVHFTAIRVVDGELVAEPLLPEDMTDHIDRYLQASPVDFFYLTALQPEQP